MQELYRYSDETASLIFCKDDDSLWLTILKNKYANKLKKNYDSVKISQQDCEKVYNWSNVPEKDLLDGDSVSVYCDCSSKCSIIEFSLDKSENKPINVFVELYMHMAYRSNYTRYMHFEVCMPYNDFGVFARTLWLASQNKI